MTKSQRDAVLMRKAFCNICSARWPENPDGSACSCHFEGMSEDDICLVLKDPRWLARAARRFVKMEQASRQTKPTKKGKEKANADRKLPAGSGE
ncbi:MAG: hypothetical protein Q8Q12_00635 [bacterium]|nr:hypothetical protein [bacterium]